MGLRIQDLRFRALMGLHRSHRVISGLHRFWEMYISAYPTYVAEDSGFTI